MSLRRGTGTAAAVDSGGAGVAARGVVGPPAATRPPAELIRDVPCHIGIIAIWIHREIWR